MKAITYQRYGGPEVLQLQEVDTPPIEESGVLVRVRAAAVNPYDWHFMRGEPYFMRLMFGLRAPKRHSLGVDFSGVVEAAGSAVTDFAPGDEVYGMADGAFAESVACPAVHLACKPATLSHEQAAAVPLAGLTALQGLRDAGQLQAGQRVLIVGASGGVGTFAVQIARALGATVTAVCSTRNVEQARRLGADHVIDYTQEDFTQGGQRFDLIFDTVGNRSVAEYRQVLAPQGRFVTTAFLPALALLGPWLALRGGPAMQNMLAKPNRADLDFLAGLLEAGKLAPVIDRCYPLAEAPAALHYVGAGHARGKVVIVPEAAATSARASGHVMRDEGGLP